jgi:uncharacterized membrane protein YphA (DoxX/SURF4 family)
MIDLQALAFLVLRVSYSFVFLNAAWQCGKDRNGLQWTIEESRILFGKYAPLFGPAGIAVMGLGGLSILLGVYAEIGGGMLAFFVLPGALIHLRKRDEAGRLGAAIPVSEADKPRLGQLAVSAVLGHYGSAMKNFSLFGPGAFLAMMGSGAWSLDRLWR